MPSTTTNLMTSVNTGRELQQENRKRRIKKELSREKASCNNFFQKLDSSEKEQYLVLFYEKDIYTTKEQEEFWRNFENFHESQKEELDYDFSYIVFPKITNTQKSFNEILRETDKQTLNLSNCLFNDTVSFVGKLFQTQTTFEGSVFKKEVSFKNTTFQNKINFSMVLFEDDVFFGNAIFYKNINFENSATEGIFDFSDTSFFSLKLDKTDIQNASFLRISGISHKGEKIKINKKHFESKETARIIKALLEKENNITESNKYFAIEQELFVEDLKKRKTEPRRISTLASLYANKLISNFGMSWFRAFFSLMFLSYFFMLIYIKLDPFLSKENKHIVHFVSGADTIHTIGMLLVFLLLYIVTYIQTPCQKRIFYGLISGALLLFCCTFYSYDKNIEYQNYLTMLINPINSFKNTNLYQGIETFGMLVRIITLTVLYQLIVSFRQNTRRK